MAALAAIVSAEETKMSEKDVAKLAQQERVQKERK